MCFMAAFLSQTAINVESGSSDTQLSSGRSGFAFHFIFHSTGAG